MKNHIESIVGVIALTMIILTGLGILSPELWGLIE
jgi:hypothetical protein